MSAKKRTGGRVTPKGTQPATTSKGHGKAAASGSAAPKALPVRNEVGHGKSTGASFGPTRAGPRGGNR
jgi:hypothetical protein